MDIFSRGGTSIERITASWIIAGLAFLTLAGISLVSEAPERAVAMQLQEVPIYAIDEELAPLTSG